MLKNKKIILIWIIALAVMCFSVMTLILTETSYASAEAAKVLINENFVESGSHSWLRKSNMTLSEEGSELGLICGNEWADKVKGGTGYLIYKVSADEGKKFDSFNIDASVYSGHHDGLYCYQYAVSDKPDYIWTAGVNETVTWGYDAQGNVVSADSENAVTFGSAHGLGRSGEVIQQNFTIEISSNGNNWTTVYDLVADDKGVLVNNHKGTDSTDWFELKNIVVSSSVLNNATDVFVKFNFNFSHRC